LVPAVLTLRTYSTAKDNGRVHDVSHNGHAHSAVKRIFDAQSAKLDRILNLTVGIDTEPTTADIILDAQELPERNLDRIGMTEADCATTV
jgi:hypothetical protein